MTEIKIPFNDWSKEKLRLGFKCATSRTKKYGESGDTFIVEDIEYVIEFVAKLPLWFIGLYLHQTEGCDKDWEFQNVWIKIHPKKGWDGDQEVWYHCFASTADKEVLKDLDIN